LINHSGELLLARPFWGDRRLPLSSHAREDGKFFLFRQTIKRFPPEPERGEKCSSFDSSQVSTEEPFPEDSLLAALRSLQEELHSKEREAEGGKVLAEEISRRVSAGNLISFISQAELHFRPSPKWKLE